MTISPAPRHALAAHRGRLASMAVLAAIAVGLVTARVVGATRHR